MVNQIRPLGYSDEAIGQMGLAATLVGCVMSISFGFITDRLKHKTKLTILVLLTVSTAGWVWLMLMCQPGSQVTMVIPMLVFTS